MPACLSHAYMWKYRWTERIDELLVAKVPYGKSGIQKKGNVDEMWLYNAGS